MKRKAQRVTLSYETVDAIFEAARSQEDYLLGLYAAVIPDFPEVLEVVRWPTCSEAMWHHICEKAIAWDKEHVSSMPGGAWLNWGFSADPELQTHVIHPCVVHYKPGYQPALLEATR